MKKQRRLGKCSIRSWLLAGAVLSLSLLAACGGGGGGGGGDDTPAARRVTLSGVVTDSTGLTQAYIDSINALPPATGRFAGR